jgi:3-oxoacyl-[acyl-carrier-protein] synthase-3
MVNAYIEAIEYYLPEATLSNEDLSEAFPEWSVDKIEAKTGISTRHIVGRDEYASDLAVKAGRLLFERHEIGPTDVDFVILCTQSPDFYLPVTAATVHQQLGLRVTAGATDINLGCSGYVYALGLAKGMVEAGLAASVLVLTVDTYTRYVNDSDRSVRTLFGDGASASLIGASTGGERLSAFSYGTDGTGAGALIVPNGGLRSGAELSPKSNAADRGLSSNGYDLYMDGPAIFNFALDVVPTTVETILRKASLAQDDVDLFVFHQANSFMLEHLRKKLGIDGQRFYVSMAESGNTVSSTIPIALADAQRAGVLREGMKVMLVGFGVGFSWGGVMVTW